MNKQKILILILCFVLGFTIAACSSRPEPVPSETPFSELPPQSDMEFRNDGKTFINTLELPAGSYTKFALPKFTELVKQKQKINSDTVGWLHVPDTTIDDVVLWYPGDENQYYYRRNFEKRESYNGCYYADFRCTFNGRASGLSPNTVIYGHSMSDDPNDARMKFSPLKFFKDEKFARETPYIYFSTPEEDLVWEVFAVFFATEYIPYNIPQPQDFSGIINECRKRSLYNYGTQVDEGDKILTLSTCTYSLPDGTRLSYPNEYRYAVMAKLVTDKSGLKNEAEFVRNPSPEAI